MPVGRWLAFGALALLCARQSPPVLPPQPTLAQPTLAPPALAKPTSAPPAVTANRVEVLNAANAASAGGKSADAAALYQRVLDTPPTASESAAVSAAIADYAHFRAMVALVAAGDENGAHAHLDALDAREPNGVLARLGDQFWEQYSMTASAKAACAQLQPQIASQAGTVLSTLREAGVSGDPASLCSIA